MSGRRARRAGGIRGDFADSCTVCLRGTDTALAFKGSAEFITAALQHLGLGEEAAALVSLGTGCGDDLVPIGEITLMFRVCSTCAERVGLHVGVGMVDGIIPCFGCDPEVAREIEGATP